MVVRRVILILAGWGVLAGSAGCASWSTAKAEDANNPGRRLKRPALRYAVQRLKEPTAIDADWGKPAWRNVEPLELRHFMGGRPGHFPKTQAKLLYDDQFLYVAFRVEDRYVLAVAQKHQGAVWRDSCVAFFFAPAADVTVGYFRLEVNCGGTMGFGFQNRARKSRVRVSPSDLARIEVAHTLPEIVEPEITEPTTWVVEYRVPIEMLARYCPALARPAPGVVWRGNFYKCGDKTSHPHWLTWSPVDVARPRFDEPDSFGALTFR